MHLRDLTATFSTALGVPPIKVVEHHRSIRDGTQAIAGNLSAADLEGLQRMFNGKPGPGGGFDIDAFGCAFFLTAFLVDGPRHTVTSKTAAIMYATSTSRCRLTGATKFGTALAAVCGIARSMRASAACRSPIVKAGLPRSIINMLAKQLYRGSGLTTFRPASLRAPTRSALRLPPP